MRIAKSARQIKEAQTAVEYLLLLGVVTAFVLVAFKQFLPKVNKSSEYFFNETAIGILGNAPLNGTLEAERTNYP